MNAKSDTARRVPDNGPEIEEQDWDALESGALDPTSVSENGDIRYRDEGADPAEAEQDDDNPYQESDEALPDDKAEKALSRDPSMEGSTFDEV